MLDSIDRATVILVATFFAPIAIIIVTVLVVVFA